MAKGPNKPKKLPSGSWRVRWLDATGKRQSATFDTYKDADVALRARLVVADERRARGDVAPRVDRTFDELCDYWLAMRAPEKRSAKTDESFIRKHLRPAFGARRVSEVGPALVDEYRAARRALKPKTINLHLTLLISMLNAAVDLGWIASRPKIRKPRVRLFPTDFRYLKTPAEVTRFLTAARETEDEAFALYATAIYTGLRAGELAGLWWDDVSFERRMITVQRSYGELTKAEEVRHVPILDPLLPVLKAWRLRSLGTLAFPNEAGHMHQRSDRIFQETLHRVLEVGGFPSPETNGKTTWYITFHCLRHTFASHWMMGGGDLFRLQRILGHHSATMTQRYAHLAPDVFVSDHARLSSLMLQEDAATVHSITSPVAAR